MVSIYTTVIFGFTRLSAAVLQPLLFLCYIDNIIWNLLCKVQLYADEILILNEQDVIALFSFRSACNTIQKIWSVLQHRPNKIMKKQWLTSYSSVNRMAAGSRLPRSSHGIFSFVQLFSNTSYLTSLTGCRTRSPTDLQYLCCKALIIKSQSDFERAYLFNEYFHSIFTQSSPVITPRIASSTSDLFTRIFISEQDTYAVLSTLDTSKATGIDGILKSCVAFLSKPLQHLFTCCLRQSNNGKYILWYLSTNQEIKHQLKIMDLSPS